MPVVQAAKDLQQGNRILYVICAEGKANKNISIATLVSLNTHPVFSECPSCLPSNSLPCPDLCTWSTIVC